MINPIDKIKSSCSTAEFLYELRQLSDADQTQLAATTTCNDVAIVGTWISSKLRVRHGKLTNLYGGLLSFFMKITDCHDRRELFENLLEDLGISRTQAYRAIRVYQHFGSVLYRQPELFRHFSAESLKILSEEKSSNDARREALAHANSKNRVTIKVAVSLVRKHAVAKTPESPESSATKAVPQQSRKPAHVVWSFVGSVVRLVVKPKTAKSQTNLADVISDLERLLEQMKRKHASSVDQNLEKVS